METIFQISRWPYFFQFWSKIRDIYIKNSTLKSVNLTANTYEDVVIGIRHNISYIPVPIQSTIGRSGNPIPQVPVGFSYDSVNIWEHITSLCWAIPQQSMNTLKIMSESNISVSWDSVFHQRFSSFLRKECGYYSMVVIIENQNDF